MQAYIPELIDKIEAVSLAAKENFQSLDASQLNWKTSPEDWSVAQCLHHLITTNELYFPIFTAVQNDKVPQNIFSRMRLFSGFFGRMLVKQLGPEVIRKAKSPTTFQPSQSELPADILDQFLAHQHKLVQQYQALPSQDFSKLIIISPAASFVTYSLKDALHILAGHEERHLAQAKGVMQMPQFPINLQA
ncbi:MAG: DinB family protein [Bacteroidia bacterium]